MTGLDWEIVALLAGVALVAGCVDAIAGGGGLLTVPALLFAGLDPASAIATNKLQGVFGTASSTAAFARARLIDWRAMAPMAALAFAGSVLGALGVQLLSRRVLEGLVPLLLVAIALYFALSRRMADTDARARLTPFGFGLAVPPLVGFYDGLFGPGAGSFYLVGFVTLLGYGVTRATAQTKLLNLASNAGGLLFFVAAGTVVWPAGLAMGVSALIGAQVGSRLALRLGARLIRPLLVVIACLMAGRLLLDPANPLRQAFGGLIGP